MLNAAADTCYSLRHSGSLADPTSLVCGKVQSRLIPRGLRCSAGFRAVLQQPT